MPKQFWSPNCTQFLESIHLTDRELDREETHLKFQTREGDYFVLKLSSTEVLKVWQELSGLLQTPDFPLRKEVRELH